MLFIHRWSILLLYFILRKPYRFTFSVFLRKYRTNVSNT